MRLGFVGTTATFGARQLRRCHRMLPNRVLFLTTASPTECAVAGFAFEDYLGFVP